MKNKMETTSQIWRQASEVKKTPIPTTINWMMTAPAEVKLNWKNFAKILASFLILYFLNVQRLLRVKFEIIASSAPKAAAKFGRRPTR